MGILSVLGRKPVVIEEPEPEIVIDPDTIPDGAYLAVMEPDVAGISSFRLRFFAKAGPAEKFIATLRPDARRGTHAFWAMHDRPQPQEDTHIEALVLVRADQSSDVVYVVSFLDIESANSFTRFEVKRGLALENVLIYWAAFTQIREELDSVSIVTATAPPALDGDGPAVAEPAHMIQEAEAVVDIYVERPDSVACEILAPPIEEISVIDEPIIGRESPIESIVPEFTDPDVEGTPGVAEPLIDTVEPASEIESIVPEFAAPDVEDEPAVDEPLVETVEPGPEIESIIPEFTAPDVEDEPVIDETVDAIVEPGLELESIIDPDVDPDQALLDQAYVFRHEGTLVEEVDAEIELVESERVPSIAAVTEISLGRALRDEGADAGMIVGAGELAGPVISYGGDEEVERRQPTLAELFPVEVLSGGVSEVEAENQAEVTNSRPVSAQPQMKPETQPDNNDAGKPFHIEQEIGRLLKNSRWEKRDSPFDGFNSPPGRF